MSKEATVVNRSVPDLVMEAVGALRTTFASPFGAVLGIIVLLGLVLTGLRFTGGLAAVTNLSDYNAWGIWIGLIS
jgi:hypothetical protein